MNPPIEYGVSAYVSLSIISNASPTRKSTIAVITMVRTSTRDFVGFFFFFFTLSPPFLMLLLYTNVSIKSIEKMRKSKKFYTVAADTTARETERRKPPPR